jgi:two-component system, response regulator PdtaR
MASMQTEADATILVVEDEEFARLIVCDYLKEGGFAVLEASNAEHAIAILEQRADVRAVVLDVVMPGAMDGIALAHLIHARWSPIGLWYCRARAFPGWRSCRRGPAFCRSLISGRRSLDG